MGLSGFVVYDKTLSNSTSNNNKNDSSSVTNQTNNSYEVFKDTFINTRNKLNDTVINFVTKEYELILDNNLNLKLKSASFKSEYVISEDVLSFDFINYFDYPSGTYYEYLYLIKKDGTVSKTNLEKDKFIQKEGLEVIDNLYNLKNIVNIVDANVEYTEIYTDERIAHGPLFVDINGNIYQ